MKIFLWITTIRCFPCFFKVKHTYFLQKRLKLKIWEKYIYLYNSSQTFFTSLEIQKQVLHLINIYVIYFYKDSRLVFSIHVSNINVKKYKLCNSSKKLTNAVPSKIKIANKMFLFQSSLILKIFFIFDELDIEVE